MRHHPTLSRLGKGEGWGVGKLWVSEVTWLRLWWWQVLAYIDYKHKHHILYDDGEDEWIQLTKEAKVWRHKGRGASLPAGIAQGEPPPRSQRPPPFPPGSALLQQRGAGSVCAATVPQS